MLPRIIVCALLLLSTLRAAESEAPEKVEHVGNLNKPELIGKLPKVIDESSGLIKSKKYPDRDVFWTHNDSGDSARIFAVTSKGALLRIVDIPGAENVDWEEITMDEQGRIIVCDCGDNHHNDNYGRRKGVVLYRLPEPDAFDPKEKIEKPQVFRFVYPRSGEPGAGIFDAEGCFTRAGAAYLFSKQGEGASCYKLPLPEKAPDETIEVKRVAWSSTFNVVTGAALSPDGRQLAMLNYLCVMVIELPEPFEKLQPNDKGELPIFKFPRRSVNCFLGQTEAVAWDGADLLLTTEGGDIFRISK